MAQISKVDFETRRNLHIPFLFRVYTYILAQITYALTNKLQHERF